MIKKWLIISGDQTKNLLDFEKKRLLEVYFTQEDTASVSLAIKNYRQVLPKLEAKDLKNYTKELSEIYNINTSNATASDAVN